MGSGYYLECAITCCLTILIQIFYVCGTKVNLGHALFPHDLQGNSYLHVVSSSISVRNHGANKVYSTNFLTSFFSQFLKMIEIHDGLGHCMYCASENALQFVTSAS